MRLSSRSIFVLIVWLAGAAAYLGLSLFVSRELALFMKSWARESGLDWAMQFEIRRFGPALEGLCVFWGAMYASALARPLPFGGSARIWKHLLLSNGCGLLGCTFLLWAAFFPLPNLRSDRALYALITLKVTLATLSFALSLGSWVQLAFRRAGTEPRLTTTGNPRAASDPRVA
jgi:hypothetical protein